MSEPTALSGQPLAKQVASTMAQHDQVSRMLGIELLSVDTGHAVTRMTVTENMVNGFGICHGGITYTLADTTFAYACNSRNNLTYALHCTMTYSKPVYPGDLITAEAKELVLNGRTGLYDVTLCNQHGQEVGHFRGGSYQTQKQVIP